MKKLTLNRNQLAKLAEIYTYFPEVEQFTINVDHSSGIGTGLVVTFNLFGDQDKKSDTSIDLTDVSTW